MTRPDLDAIRARWPTGRVVSGDAHVCTDIPALLAYVEELEGRTSYTVGETELANRIAHAEQRFVDEYDLRKAAEKRIEKLTEERDEERMRTRCFEQALAEAQTDVYMEAKSNVELREKLHELRTRSIDAIATRLRGTVCSFAVGSEMVMVPGEQVAALLEGFVMP